MQESKIYFDKLTGKMNNLENQIKTYRYDFNNVWNNAAQRIYKDELKNAEEIANKKTKTEKTSIFNENINENIITKNEHTSELVKDLLNEMSILKKENNILKKNLLNAQKTFNHQNPQCPSNPSNPKNEHLDNTLDFGDISGIDIQ